MVLPVTHVVRSMLGLLSRENRRVLAHADAGLAGPGLTSTRAAALFCFQDESGLLVGEPAEDPCLAQSAPSGLAARMVEAGLLPTNRRAAHLTLTPAGRCARTAAARLANIANTEMI
jgi:DNA-binding MarR family transcriptional regulator